MSVPIPLSLGIVSSLWDSLMGDRVTSFTDAPSDRWEGELARRRGGESFQPPERKPLPEGLLGRAEMGCKLGMVASVLLALREGALELGDELEEGTAGLSYGLDMERDICGFSRLVLRTETWVSALGLRPLFLPI